MSYGKLGHALLKCSPSNALKEQFKNLVSAAPESYRFEVIDEDGSNGNLRTHEPGTWFVGAHKSDITTNTMLMLTIAQNIDEKDDYYHYMVRVKADHNRCWSDWRCHKADHMNPDELDTIRTSFMENWGNIPPFDSMKPWNRKGSESVTILASRFETFDDAGDFLLEIIDTLE